MRFWAGLILTLFGGLLGLGLFREWIKLNSSILNDTTFDIISLIILIIGLIISIIDHLKQSKDLKKLKTEQKGRTFEPKQRDNLIKDLKDVTKTKVTLMSIQGDRESYRFANELKEILIELNWDVDGVWEEIIIGGIGPGISIREKSSEINSIGKIINEIINGNNITSRVIMKSNLEPNLIEIIIGSRP